jgi:two-component system, OmpR family, copper resistance phosphate regulon response regulator CusR
MGDKSIRIVEDEQRLAEVLKKQLEEANFSADIANDGYIGRRLIEETRKYDLVILDINLPLINGYDLCNEIRKTE